MKINTSNDSNAYIQMHNGIGERGSNHGNCTHNPTSNDHRSAAIAIDQYAAHWPCRSKREERKISQLVHTQIQNENTQYVHILQYITFI